MGSWTDARRPSNIDMIVHAAIATNANDVFSSHLTPFAGQVVHGSFCEITNRTAGATDYVTIAAVKTTTSNILAATTMASLAVTTTNLVADTPQAMTLNATLANTQFAAGAVIAGWANFAGGGLAITQFASARLSVLYDMYDLTS